MKFTRRVRNELCTIALAIENNKDLSKIIETAADRKIKDGLTCCNRTEHQ